MKINILFEFVEGPWGGGNQFLKALRDIWRKQGRYSEYSVDAEVILFNSHHCLDQILELKRRFPQKIFIHRLDGPIQLVRGTDKEIDEIIFRTNEAIADGTIYQSHWIKEQSLSLGLKENSNNTIIINAPDPELFNHKCKKIDINGKLKIIMTSWSGNWIKGFDVYSWIDKNLDFNRYDVSFIGNSPVKFNNISINDPMNSRDLSIELKKHHIYLTASKNEPCSNALIEAMHCGLPAIGYNNGGTPEIIREAGKLFNHSDEIPGLLEELSSSYNEYRNKIMLPTLDKISDEYFNFAEGIKNNFENKLYTVKHLKRKDVVKIKKLLKKKKFSIPGKCKKIIKRILNI